MIMIMVLWAHTKIVGVTVMLLEQDKPMNYEEQMVDLSARNDLESWNPIK
jgi:hypothetical protein